MLHLSPKFWRHYDPRLDRKMLAITRRTGGEQGRGDGQGQSKEVHIHHEKWHVRYEKLCICPKKLPIR